VTEIGTEIAQAIAEDAEALALLHDREPTPALIEALREAGFPGGLGLLPASPAAVAAWRAMAEGLAALPEPLTAADADQLAAEYAALYLTGAHGASPCESAWTSEEGLVCQEAMFAWRAQHQAAGLAAADWRRRPDDHLVLQLLYLARVARQAATTADWRALATVLDEHPLHWLPGFAARVAARSASPFYAGLAVLTVAWLESLRDLLAAGLGEPRPGG
jgi:TorA maturation chaperone TorD